MPNIAVLGGTGYLASIVNNQNNVKKNKYIFFSRKKKTKNFINFSNISSLNKLKKYDFIVHLLGPSKNLVQNRKKLIVQKNKVTSKICDLCIKYNIRLIYVSSLQIYGDYGKKDILKNHKVKITSLYAKSHFESEEIIKKKFKKKSNMFTILRLGNVFGFRKYKNIEELNNNLINNFCKIAVFKNSINIKNASVQRTFIPSEIFIKILNMTINHKLFFNNVKSIGYKVYSLKEISLIIKKRIKKKFNKEIPIKYKIYNPLKKMKIYTSPPYNFKFLKKKFINEIDYIINNIKKN